MQSLTDWSSTSVKNGPKKSARAVTLSPTLAEQLLQIAPGFPADVATCTPAWV